MKATAAEFYLAQNGLILVLQSTLPIKILFQSNCSSVSLPLLIDASKLFLLAASVRAAG